MPACEPVDVPAELPAERTDADPPVVGREAAQIVA